MSNAAPSDNRTTSVRPQQRRDVSSWRQFGALAYKNWLLKKRKPVSLILELLLPVAFMALLGALASSSSSQTNEPAMVDGAAYPVPTLAFLRGQTVSTPAQPNILCYDNNLFNLCACDYPKQPLQEELLSDINDYFQSGFNSNPLQALFQTSHSIKAYYAVCTGVAAAASSPALTQAQGCALAQNYHDLCGSVPTYPGVPTFPAALLNACPVTTTTIWSVADAEIVINNAIKAADLAGIGVSIPAASIEGNCEAMHLAVVPLDTTWAAGQAGLSDTEAAALAFYQDIATSVGAESVLGFASMGALDDYVTQKGYSRDAAIPLVGVAVVFETAAPDWSYTLRSNYTMQLNDDGYRVERVPQTNSVTDTSMRNALSTSNYQGRTVYPFNQAYLTSGLLTLQQELDAFIMRQEGVAAPDVQYRVGFFPSPEFTQNDFWPNVGDMFAIVMVLVLMYPVSNVIRALVVDKELKLKEGMLQMGLGPKVYTLSWLFQFVMTFFVLAVLLTAIGSGSVFENSSPGIVFLFFFLFFLATIALCFFLASFFQKARSASTYGSLVFFLTVFPYFAVSGDGASASSRIGACVLPSTCFAVGTLPFKDYEGNGQGVTADTVSSHDSVNISMAQVLGMLLFDIVLYSFLAWYAGQVIKSEWGTNRPWYFLVTKAYWFPAAAARDDRAAAQEALLADETQAGRRTIEPVAETLRRQLGEGGASCVAMRGLTKTFPSPNGEPFKAVDMLDLTMYRGQITALLGHNGAGKTTTMNMLTGMMPVTSGRAYVTGLDVKSQMTQIRQDLGVCPQHDILYPDLTVVEHLRMFAAFKGVPRKRVKEDVDLMIKAVGLVEKRGEKSAGLSGGQKRKLSVAIAFIGGSRVVFLDEPTSGMDPHSRRFTWDVIRRQKEGRVIVLTTHFMDEADLLGDRIAIMSQGMLKCCGSSLFLKGLYGVGYNLTVVKTISGTEGQGDGKEENPADMQKRLEGASAEIEKLVRRHVRQAQVLSDVGAEVAFQLPTNASASFKPLLLELDDNKSALCVGSYGMSVTTLEEVFIRVAHGTETAEERREISAMRQRSHSSSAAADGAAPGVARRPSDLGDIPEEAAVSKAAADAAAKEGQMFHPMAMTNAERFRRHVRALVVKRALTYKRDRKMVCFTTLAPAVFLLLGLLILLVFPSPDQPSLLLSFEDYNPSTQQSPLPYATTCDNADNVAPPPVCGIPPLITEVSTAFGVTPAPVTLPDGTTQELNQWLLDNRASTFTSGASTYGAFGWNTVDVTGGAAAVDATVHSNFTAKHAAPLYNNLLSNAMLQAAGVDSTIAVTMWPLPATSFESNINDNTFTFPTVIFLMVGFAFIPAAWCGYVVRERETKSKHQQVVSGVSLSAYWASTYAWDMASFILTPPAVMALLAMFGKSGSLIDGAAAGLACFLLLLLWGPANMGCTYFLSFFFTSHSISMTTILFINWVFGLIAPLAVFFMLFFDSVKTIARVLKWVLRIHPGFCLGDGLLNLGNRAIVRFALNLDSDPTPFSIQVAGANLLYMLVEIFVYALLTLWVERVFSGTRTIMSYFSDKRLARRMNALKDPDSFWDSDLKGAAPEGAASGKKRGGWCCKSAGVEDVAMVPAGGAEVVSEDPDVLTERDRVSRGVSDVIQIQGLRKVYPASTGMKVAVRNMWLGIPKGQCFALLGINGAGKTTAISTLCGEQQPTQGRATLAGVDVAKDAEAVHRLIGYCPQFDALFESMTAREHLEMYARIKGLRESDVKAAAEAKMTEMDLLQYADKLAGGYSGGNKRKLSVAVAMLGGPEIVFLDEPSTGVDPVARRHMWEVISRIVTTNKQCALVLTTHSMEEAEALCQRIGIMVGGRLQCLGSAQHLKSRFGSGYQLEVTAALPTSAAASAAAQSLCASAGVAPGAVVLSSEAQVKQALRGSYPALESEISQDGRGSLLWQELLAEGSIQTQDVAEWALQESACNAILAFIARHFAGAQLLEKQGGKLRLALPPQEGMTLGAIFGLIEDSRAELGIGDYALGQTSLEQIFNGFAAKQAEETSDAPGRAADLQHLMADSTIREKTGSGVVMLSADAAV